MDTTPQFSIELEYASFLGYPQAFNKVPFISSLKITSTDLTGIQELNVVLRIISLGQELCDARSTTVANFRGIADFSQSDFTDSGVLCPQFRGSKLDALLSIESMQDGYVSVELCTDEHILHSQEFDLKVVPAQCWWWQKPREVYAAALTAYSFPHHPEIKKLLLEAAQIYTTSHPGESLSGYQTKNAQKVDNQVKALFEAQLRRDIKYVNPPASWELLAQKNTTQHNIQKIRTPTEVLVERHGTCIDTTLVFAGILEAAGLNPIIALIPGHAFVGYWRIHSRLDLPVTPLRDCLNFVDDGYIQFIETTLLTHPGTTFEKACVIGNLKIQGPDILSLNSNAVLIDVIQARLVEQISPLPLRLPNEDGGVTLIEPPPLVFHVEVSTLNKQAAQVSVDTSLPPRVAYWRKQLLDLNLSNRLINFKIERDIYIQIPMNKGDIASIEDFLQHGHTLELIPHESDERYEYVQSYIMNRGIVNDPRANEPLTLLLNQLGYRRVYAHMKPQRYLTSLRRITRNAKSIIDSTGANQLYLAVGSLVWSSDTISKSIIQSHKTATANAATKGKKLPEENPYMEVGSLRSPLILIPIHLKQIKRGGVFGITLDESSPIMPNFTLLEKLERELDFKLPELHNPPTDSAGIDINGLFASIRQHIATYELTFRVDETCAIGFFDFGNYRLWRDLGDNWEKFAKQPLVKHLIESPNDTFKQPVGTDHTLVDIEELAVSLPLDCDNTQVEAISLALSGQSCVIEGPPGTGKSQTIANMIFHGIRMGKRILFVTEKATAADVVIDRLAAIKGPHQSAGIDLLVLDMHDQDSSPEQIRTQINAALDVDFSMDYVDYENRQQAYDLLMHELKAYPERLHKKGKFGESLYSAWDSLLALESAPTLELPDSFLTERSTEDKKTILASIQRAIKPGLDAGVAINTPWSFIGIQMHFEDISETFLGSLRSTTQALYAAAKLVRQSDTAVRLLDTVTSLSELKILSTLTAPDTFELPKLKRYADPNLIQLRKKILELCDEVDQQENAGLRLRSSAMKIDFEPLFMALAEAERAVLFRNSKVQQAIQTIEAHFSNGSLSNYPTATDARAAIRSQQHTDNQLNELVSQHPEIQLSTTFVASELPHRIDLRTGLTRIDTAVTLITEATQPIPAMMQYALSKATAADIQSVHDVSSRATELFAMLPPDDTSLSIWRQHQTLGNRILSGMPAIWEDAVQNDFILFHRWTALIQAIAPLKTFELEHIGYAMCTGELPYPLAAIAFSRAFYTRLLQRLLLEANLQQFDASKLEANLDKYALQLKELRKHAAMIALKEIIEHRKAFMQSNIEKITDLRRELQKTKRQLKVRELLTQYADVITEIMPCTVASPNSVAMLLDISVRPYDLVIFDEASQIRVTHAINSLGRAHAAVICGDTKQMPPTSVAESSLTEDDEMNIGEFIDQESILSECVLADLPNRTLSWHFRSQNEALIAFSNAAYYDGKLKTLPSPQDGFKKTDALRFVKVDGSYIRVSRAKSATTEKRASARSRVPQTFADNEELTLPNSNPAEAHAICQEIARIQNDPVTANLSIGVCTFNAAQEKVINSMMTSEFVNPSLVEQFEKTGSFVKSLEEIQGDEADIMLFSIAFAKDENGVVPLNFGPLNKKGGERRLNVAITRARRQVIVFCSFEPEELLAEKSGARGVNDLKKYLLMAKYGTDTIAAKIAQNSVHDRHREDIAVQLRRRGFIVKTDVGLTDFRIDIVITDAKHPERTIGVLLDGPRWHKRATVNDRDVFPIKMLKQRMGWHEILRIWLPTWMKNPQAQMDRISDALARIPLAPAPTIDTTLTSIPQLTEEIRPAERTIQPDSEGSRNPDPILLVQPASTDSSIPPSNDAPADTTNTPHGETRPVFVPWQPSVRGESGILDDLDTPRHRRLVAEVMIEIINAEGPIQPARLAKLTGAAFGFLRMPSKRADKLYELTLPGIRRDKDDGEFYYPAKTKPSEYMIYRVAAQDMDAERDIDEISLQELSNAAVDLIGTMQHTSIDTLIKETLRLFGIRRVTPSIRERALSAIARANKTKRLKLDKDFVFAIAATTT